MKHVDHIISEHDVLKYLTQLKMKYQQQSNSKSQQCPYIISLYSTFQDDDNLYFELEYIKGCTVMSQIRYMNPAIQSNMPFYASQVIRCLEYLHSHNIIYRDLKPENLVIDMNNNGHIKFVDFGFSK